MFSFFLFLIVNSTVNKLLSIQNKSYLQTKRITKILICFFFEKDLVCSQNPPKKYLRSYLDKIYAENNFPVENSLYLPQVMFLKHDLVEEIFYKIDLLLKTIVKQDSYEYPLKMRISKKHVSVKTRGFVYSDSAYDVNFTFVIRNPVELKYATNMLSLYTRLVIPFLEANKEKLSRHSERLTRFFYLNGFNHTDQWHNRIGYVGKTFVNPKTSFFMKACI